MYQLYTLHWNLGGGYSTPTRGRSEGGRRSASLRQPRGPRGSPSGRPRCASTPAEGAPWACEASREQRECGGCDRTTETRCACGRRCRLQEITHIFHLRILLTRFLHQFDSIDQYEKFRVDPIRKRHNTQVTLYIRRHSARFPSGV